MEDYYDILFSQGTMHFNNFFLNYSHPLRQAVREVIRPEKIFA
jgi:hypothetical protein